MKSNGVEAGMVNSVNSNTNVNSIINEPTTTTGSNKPQTPTTQSPAVAPTTSGSSLGKTGELNIEAGLRAQQLQNDPRLKTAAEAIGSSGCNCATCQGAAVRP